MFKFVSTKNINELFQRAILHNDIQRTKLILEEAIKDSRFNIDQISDEGLTALQYSCFAGNLEIVKVLVGYGANWKIRDRDGYTLLHASAMAGNCEVMQYLLQIGLKPILKSDEGVMPIDVTDEISVIVILLRSMLDKGYLQEMQDYMMDHPKLKRNIFKELEKVKCREHERNEILKEKPYTSHSSRPAKSSERKTKSRDGAKRSKSTFSELSDSLQQLDKLGSPKYTDMNNNAVTTSQYTSSRPETIEEELSTLKRENSYSSTSSQGSKASSRASGTSGGILRNGSNYDTKEVEISHKSTQKYLESRFPVNSRPKSVTFDIDEDISSHNRKLSDCYHPRIPPPFDSSAQASRNSADEGRSYEPDALLDEPLYENALNLRLRAKLSLSEPRDRSSSLKLQNPPPLPPRAPTTQLSDGFRINHISLKSRFHEDSYEDTREIGNISDRQLGSETDSGIDVDESAGRVFALSVNERREANEGLPFSYPAENYSKPIGLFYSEQLKGPLARQHVQDYEAPCSFAVCANTVNPKYKSWNGRSCHGQSRLPPYSSHSRKNVSRESYYEVNSTGECGFGSVPNINQQCQSEDYLTACKQNSASQRQHDLSDDLEVTYDLDNQPEIML